MNGIKAVRRTLRLPRATRSRLLPLIAGGAGFKLQHEKRYANLHATMRNSSNSYVEYLAKRSEQDAVGVMGVNRAKLRLKYGFIGCCEEKVRLHVNIDGEDSQRAGQIRELLYIREQTTSMFTKDELQELIEYVCTT